MSKDLIIEVFGQFAIELEDGPKMYETKAEASTALSEYKNGAKFNALAASYCSYAGLEGKSAKGKSNVVTSYLSWVDAGMPEAQSKSEVDKSDEEDANEATEETQF